jgi:hypothetical protein
MKYSNENNSIEVNKERKLEKKIDSFFLSNYTFSKPEYEELKMFSINHFYKILYYSFDKSHLKDSLTIKTTSFIGSFLTSRFLKRGFVLDFNNFYLYELANAISSLSIVDCLRLKYTIESFKSQIMNYSSISKLMQQVDRFIYSIELRKGSELELELKFLNFV